jgi:FAD:protein FMN transferase
VPTDVGAVLLDRRSLLTLDFDPPARRSEWLRVHRTAMACRVEVTLQVTDACHVNAAQAALDEAERVESRLTLFHESSELSWINREAARRAAAASDDLFSLLTRCRELHSATEGAFDITSTPLSRCWGFLKRHGRVPPEADIEAARASVGMDRVVLDADTHTVQFAGPGMELNLGSIGKGYALDRMGDVLRKRGVTRALVSAGGSSVLAIGSGKGWTIDVTSPQLPSRIGRLTLRDGALGTSGAGEQFVLANADRYGHVIDPRTGWPTRDVVSASVVVDDAATADALATAFLVGGADLAERYCRKHRKTLAFITTDHSRAQTNVFGSYPDARLEC